jgi:predicted DNA-binding transcriptional regulator YafY
MVRTKPNRPRGRSQSVTAARVARLYRLIKLLSGGPLSRAELLRRLGLNQRGFYRDVELLRTAGIRVVPHDGRYVLQPGFAAAVDLLPFPDPRLTLGEAQRLAKGATAAHRSLRQRVQQITHGPDQGR